MLLLLTSASSLLLATRSTIVMFSTPVLQNRDAAVIACFGSANARIADLTNIIYLRSTYSVSIFIRFPKLILLI